MDIAAANWNEDDNANTTAAPDGAPEGMAPSGVNNVLRAHQGAIKRFYNWSTPRMTAGTGAAYALNYAVAPGALVDGMTHLAQFHAANTSAPTLNVNGLGAIPLHYYSVGVWRVLPPGLLGDNEICRIAYHASSGAYRLLGRPDTTGDWVATGRSSARAGTILAYGQAVSRTQYAGLFAAYGGTYGGGDGSTTFNLPNLRGVVVAGKADMGGSDLGNLAGGTVLGAMLGSQTHFLSVAEMPPHSHGVSDPGHSHGGVLVEVGSAGGGGGGPISNPVPGTSGVSTTGIAIHNTGGGAAHNNVQPTRIGNYAICL